ncbi:MAG: beta-propeller domain-containing protein [Propionibacteriaceae bacterium]|jgi:uncharacterized secreted protein with C-terminal beta-propeller domain|nr:beta-propeller domain-containing protein [Propionibacteriaceae bacterium]
MSDIFRDMAEQMRPDPELTQSLLAQLADEAEAVPVQPAKPAKRPLRSALVWFAAAACLVASIGIVGLTLNPAPEVRITLVPSQPPAQRVTNAKPVSAADYAQLHQRINAIQALNGSRDGLAVFWLTDGTARTASGDLSYSGSKAGAPVPAPPGGQTYTSTNVQVAGIDEGDIVKTDGKSIFIATGRKVNIVSAKGKDTLPIAQIDAAERFDGPQDSAKAPITDGTVADLMLSGSTLIVFYQSYTATEINFQNEETPYVPFTAAEITTQLWDVADPAAPRYQTSFSQSGLYHSSRLSGDVLYLVSSYAVGPDEADPDDPATFVPQVGRDGSREVLPIKDIRAMPSPTGTRYAVVTAVDVSGQARLGQQSVLGGAETVYMSGDNLYLAALNNPDLAPMDLPVPAPPSASSEPTVVAPSASNEPTAVPAPTTSELPPPPTPADSPESTPPPSGSESTPGVAEPGSGVSEPNSGATEPASDKSWPTSGDEKAASTPSTHLVRIALASGQLQVAAQADVPGVLLNQFALDEYEQHLRVATTTVDEFSIATLHVLNADLKQVGTIPKLAKNESVQSVRFQGPIGYVVTFQQTDPLFAIDLANPAKPKVLSELKINGFSTYLHPYGDGLLLGLGMDGDKYGNISGMKLALFDISDPKNVTTITSKSIKFDSSTALDNHKAVLVDLDNDLICFDAIAWRENATESRYLVYGYDKDKGFFQHKALPLPVNYNGSNFTRGLRIGDSLYVLSEKRITAYTLDSFTKTAEVRLS